MHHHGRKLQVSMCPNNLSFNECMQNGKARKELVCQVRLTDLVRSWSCRLRFTIGIEECHSKTQAQVLVLRRGGYP